MGNSTDIKILSVNCQGLGSLEKRKDVFTFLREKNCNIYCLQDTHFTKQLETYIRCQWGFDCVFNSYSSNSRGTAILFNNNFEYKINNSVTDNDGNLIGLNISIESKNISLITLYGPNSDNVVFYENLNHIIEELGNDDIIICGDFNLVLNPELDYFNYLHINNPRSREKLLEVISDKGLIDIYREQNENTRRYTWRKKNPLKQARLDFFLVSESLLNSVNKADIVPSYRSDHSMITVSLKLNNFEKGKGLWKFNNSLLFNQDFINMIKQKIKEIKQQYALPIYNLENIDSVDNECIQFTIDDQLFLETLMMELRGKSISFSSFITKQNKSREANLMKEIEDLEKNNEISVILENKKIELEQIRKNKIQGSLIRSKAKWVEKGEKPTQYFCSLEKRHFTSKIIPKLITENNKIISNQKDILQETKSFYEKLYAENQNIKSIKLENFIDINNFNVPILSNNESENLEGPLTYEEASKTLKNMKNNKSPGSDGFTPEFFKIFWKDLGHFVIRSLNQGYAKGELSTTQKEGIVVCLPKGEKPRHFLKNWRPITLLNTIYKIGSGCIANRLKTVLDKLISPDQTGFIANRFIGENTRLTYDIMQYAEEQNIPGMLLLVDFEKAFDSLSFKFIDNTLQFFNFGESIRKWIKTFQKNIKSTINQGGNLSNFFDIGRGCRQGDPVACYCFILCAEILAIRLRTNDNIHGIKIGDKEVLISQYADDTCLVLDGSRKSIESSLNELKLFADISGLRINFSKSQVVWIGSKKYSNVILGDGYGLQWGNTKFNYLGIEYDVDLNNIVKLNYDKKLVKIKNIVKSWRRRILTPLGKITVIKTLLTSQLNHLFMSIPNPNELFIKKLNTLLFKYIWDEKPDKIKRDILYQPYNKGGLNMIDVKNFMIALKSSWIRRLFKGYIKITKNVKLL